MIEVPDRGVGETLVAEGERRPYPSGGSLYELELLVVDAEGIGRYLPGEHQVERLPASGAEATALLRDAAWTMGTRTPPPLLVVLAARILRVTYKYESMAYALVVKHVGVVQQTLALTAHALGLAACPLGGSDTQHFADATGLVPLAVPSVGEVALGLPAQG